MARSFKPSPEAYRRRLARLVTIVEAGPQIDGDASPLAALAQYRGAIAALNAITKTAAVDKQLEDLSRLHAKIRELETIIEGLTRAQADVRHNQSARVEAGPPAGAGISPAPVH